VTAGPPGTSGPPVALVVILTESTESNESIVTFTPVREASSTVTLPGAGQLGGAFPVPSLRPGGAGTRHRTEVHLPAQPPWPALAGHGPIKAVVAVEHAMLIAIWNMLTPAPCTDVNRAR